MQISAGLYNQFQMQPCGHRHEENPNTLVDVLTHFRTSTTTKIYTFKHICRVFQSFPSSASSKLVEIVESTCWQFFVTKSMSGVSQVALPAGCSSICLIFPLVSLSWCLLPSPVATISRPSPWNHFPYTKGFSLSPTFSPLCAPSFFQVWLITKNSRLIY